jgi:hypothetical protein
MESTVVIGPAPNHRTEHVREIAQLFVIHQLKVPSSHRLSHRPQRLTADAGRKVHVDPTVFVDRLTRPKRVAEKRELDRRIRGLPIHIVAVHDPRFLRMQFEPARL